MASVVSQKPPSSPSSSSSSSPSSYNSSLDDQAVGQSPVTSHLFIRPDSKGGLDRDMILRRIRHRKRATQIRDAFHAFLRVSPDRGGRDGEPTRWLDDAFSSP